MYISFTLYLHLQKMTQSESYSSQCYHKFFDLFRALSHNRTMVYSYFQQSQKPLKGKSVLIMLSYLTTLLPLFVYRNITLGKTLRSTINFSQCYITYRNISLGNERIDHSMNYSCFDLSHITLYINHLYIMK